MNYDEVPDDERVTENAAMRTDPSHPGPAIRRACIGEYAARHGGVLNSTEAAERLGVDQEALARVLDGRCGISPELALKLEAVGWGDARSWVWQQAQYDLAQTRNRLAAAAA